MLARIRDQRCFVSSVGGSDSLSQLHPRGSIERAGSLSANGQATWFSTTEWRVRFSPGTPCRIHLRSVCSRRAAGLSHRRSGFDTRTDHNERARVRAERSESEA